MYAICDDDNELDEVRICYTIKGPNDNTEKVMACPSSTDKKQCKFPIKLPNYGW